VGIEFQFPDDLEIVSPRLVVDTLQGHEMLGGAQLLPNPA